MLTTGLVILSHLPYRLRYPLFPVTNGLPGIPRKTNKQTKGVNSHSLSRKNSGSVTLRYHFNGRKP